MATPYNKKIISASLIFVIISCGLSSFPIIKPCFAQPQEYSDHRNEEVISDEKITIEQIVRHEAVCDGAEKEMEYEYASACYAGLYQRCKPLSDTDNNSKRKLRLLLKTSISLHHNLQEVAAKMTLAEAFSNASTRNYLTNSNDLYPAYRITEAEIEKSMRIINKQFVMSSILSPLISLAGVAFLTYGGLGAAVDGRCFSRTIGPDEPACLQVYDTKLPSAAYLTIGATIIIGSASYMASTLVLKRELTKPLAVE